MVLLLLLLTILLLTILDDGRATKRELPDSPRVLRVDEYQVVGFFWLTKNQWRRMKLKDRTPDTT